MDLINILKKLLKNLRAAYRHALSSNKWRLALQTLERRVKYAGMPEGQGLPRQWFPKGTPVAGMSEQQQPSFKDEVKKLGSRLEHPPPSARA